MKAFIKYGDKALCALILLWVVYGLIVSMGNMGSEPEVVEKALATAERSKNMANASKVEALVVNLAQDIKNESRWDLDSNFKRASVHFQKEEVDVGVLQRGYVKQLDGGHEHQFHPISEDSSKKQCIFPGCLEAEEAPEVYLGSPTDLKVDEVSVMTVTLSWKGVKDLREVTPEYCILQRKLPGQEEWVTVLNEEESPLQIFPVEEMSSDVEETMFAGGFQIPGEKKDEETEEEAPKKEQTFRYMDYNLDPKKDYRYRVKAFGASNRDDSVIEGLSWSSEVIATTEEDRGVRLTRYLPGLRDKKGVLRQRADGSIISPDKVYLRLSKLFSPPWSPVRYFVHHEDRTIEVGIEGKDRVGKVVRRYPVKTEDGTPVYIDRRKENFLFVSDDMSKEDIDKRLEDEKGQWNPYRIEMDFATPWKAIEVEEEIVEDKNVIVKFNAQGEKINQSEMIKKYRYFLKVVHVETQDEMRLELERDDLTTRLLKF